MQLSHPYLFVTKPRQNVRFVSESAIFKFLRSLIKFILYNMNCTWHFAEKLASLLNCKGH